MKKSQIAIKLRPNDYKDLVNLGNRVIAALTGNGNFTTPAPSLVNLQAAVDDVSSAMSLWLHPDGNHGSYDDLADLQQKSLTLWLMLRQAADYVQTTTGIAAGSDYATMRSIMSTSGFDLKSEGSPQGPLEAVADFHHFISRTLAPNEIKLKWKRPLNVSTSTNVKAYRVLKGTTAVFSAAVEIAITTKTTFMDTNTTGVTQTWYYWVIAVNNAGESPPSEVVVVSVLSN